MTRSLLLFCSFLAPAFACAQCFKAVLAKGDQLFIQGKFAEARNTWELGKDCLDFDEAVLNKRLWKIRDDDADGKVNGNDACPNVFAKTANGCPPKDTDTDGIPDASDRCPDVYGLKIFEGCPDTDGDGVPDLDDKCPATPGSKAHDGCPPPKDSDGDGIPDSQDECVNTYALTPDGCPEAPPAPCELCPEMVLVKGGTFQMGSDGDGGDEIPVHSVTVSDFYLGKFEVTQAEWRAIMGTSPSFFKDCDQCPVESVSWQDVQLFLEKLNAKTGKTYRLPVEAEWEFAARGGAQSNNYKYAGSDSIDEIAWYSDNSASKTHPVGGKNANELGLFDMSGNVWEWCQDIWHDNYSGAPSNSSAWISGGDQSHRLIRGGSWYNVPIYCRSADRSKGLTGARVSGVGFRVAQDK